MVESGINVVECMQTNCVAQDCLSRLVCFLDLGGHIVLLRSGIGVGFEKKREGLFVFSILALLYMLYCADIHHHCCN